MRIRTFLISKIGITTLPFFILPGSWAQEAAKTIPLKPDFADVRYGLHARNVLDLWLPGKQAQGQNSPLVLVIHGGGFRQGQKSVGAGTLKDYLAEGWAVAALNYRLTDTAPAPAAYLDCARALQFLRHHAPQWRIDPRRVASTGRSAGAGTSLWLALHDDLAEPQSPDPIARQSTRLTCVVVTNVQSSYDPRFAEKIGIPRPNFERHEFFLPFYGITKDEIDSPKAYELYSMAAPITYLTRDDPTVLALYTYRNETVTAKTELNVIIHHPLFGIALKREMDRLGIECIVQYKDELSGETVQVPSASSGSLATPVDFIRKHFDTIR